jgi:hypothetical protein
MLARRAARVTRPRRRGRIELSLLLCRCRLLAGTSRAYRCPLACRQLGDNRTRCAHREFCRPDPNQTSAGLAGTSRRASGLQETLKPLRRRPRLKQWDGTNLSKAKPPYGCAIAHGESRNGPHPRQNERRSARSAPGPEAIPAPKPIRGQLWPGGVS